MPSCSEFLLQCWWRGEERQCSDLFDVRKTDDGFCCSFNTLEQKQNLDISLVVQSQPAGVGGGIGGIVGWIGSIFDGGDYIDEEFVAPDTESESPPVQAQIFSPDEEELDESLKKALEILSRTRRQVNESEEMMVTNQINVTEGSKLRESSPRLERTNSASHLLGLSVLMDAKSNKYFVAPENYVGFKVMAHNPTTFPEVSSKGSIIDTGKEAFIAVSAEYTESTPLVRNLAVQKRNCIFADEKNIPNAEITVFKFYSQVLTCGERERERKLSTFFPGKLSPRMSSKNTAENLWMFAILLPEAGCHPTVPGGFPEPHRGLHSPGLEVFDVQQVHPLGPGPPARGR